MKRRELTDEEKQEASRLSRAWITYKANNAGATQTWLGAETGIGSQGAVGQYLRGVIPLNLEALMVICKAIEADPRLISPRLAGIVHVYGMQEVPLPAWLRGETYQQVIMETEDGSDFIQIPMVELRLSAGVTGFQTEPDRRGGGTLGMRRSWIERNGFNPDMLIAIQVQGDSMEPSLYANDIVVINTADTEPVDGQVFALNYEGEAVIKRMVRDAGQWWLTSDSPDQRKHQRKICQDDACIIVGRVVRKESDRI